MQHQKPVWVTSIEKDEPNIRLFVLALVQLASELDDKSAAPDQASWSDAEEEAE